MPILFIILSLIIIAALGVYLLAVKKGQAQPKIISKSLEPDKKEEETI